VEKKSYKCCATCYYKDVCEGVVVEIACGAYKPERGGDVEVRQKISPIELRR